MSALDTLPVELIEHILCQLDRRDLTAAALVCRLFNCAATPLIYRAIDAHIKDGRVCPIAIYCVLQSLKLVVHCGV